MKWFGLLIALVAAPGWAVCVVHCESSNCSWKAFKPPACTQAEPFSNEAHLKEFADKFVAERKTLDGALAQLRTLHFECGTSTRSPGVWGCSRVLKYDDKCGDLARVQLSTTRFDSKNVPADRNPATDDGSRAVMDVLATQKVGCFGDG